MARAFIQVQPTTSSSHKNLLPQPPPALSAMAVTHLNKVGGAASTGQRAPLSRSRKLHVTQASRLLSWEFRFRGPGAGPVTGTYIELPSDCDDRSHYFGITTPFTQSVSQQRHVECLLYPGAPRSHGLPDRRASWCPLAAQRRAPLRNVPRRLVTRPLIGLSPCWTGTLEAEIFVFFISSLWHTALLKKYLLNK